MNKLQLILFALLITAAGLYGQSADEIVNRADEAFKGNRIYSTSTMTVYLSDEAQPVQKIEGYTMEKDGKSYSLSIYVEPRRMKGTANLMIEDDLWVRFSSTGRVRKLSSSAKKNSAGGSDFSYADMGEGGSGLAEKYTSRLIGEEKVEGDLCHVIELTASGSDAPYEKMVVYITKDTYRYMKIDYYESGANIKSMSFYDYRTVNGKDYPFAYTMFNHTKPSRTEVVIEEFEVDSPKVQDRMFTTRYLETIR
ncbi:outer membrane lipoprotein-sorting protein [Spirochaeta isovalerica]|uniref:Outer membrane lipoprotein-sorting protein n=1 Tax=Spirochaeta isovalerica TaxID=150 RepID=A0A841R9Y5_9SPIO|nr:outer membrane lipoprotein-sorting protein [Spirochaeta isovalerica]MBB6480703.1 outer membrane lipoprotein-sorting protein [Spirochaeta isovalerica]